MVPFALEAPMANGRQSRADLYIWLLPYVSACCCLDESCCRRSSSVYFPAVGG
ncbi:hypothetical protein TTRE_0000404801 [Trichuris trichiura]|uniref:Uncharacterized protein n=1 Tax=Trichuris trichiura TaxID=36087 RepID=A0A077ZAS5_TRITR|nr:hypothetical protein TTRE_0000404801 [Trichuris trichiura]